MICSHLIASFVLEIHSCFFLFFLKNKTLSRKDYIILITIGLKKGGGALFLIY